jgi:tetratricopeptide (TPR) repeat protein
VFSETMMPASAYGWAPLRSLAEGRWRFIEAPRSELYDLAADPGQTADKSAMAPADLARLRRGLQSYVEKLKVRGQARAPAPEAAEAARSLGYLSGASGGRAGTIDPKDGIGLLAEMEQARTAARPADVVARLQDLCKRSPGNVPFLTSLARAQTAAGDLPGAIATLDTALDANPRSEFLHVHRGELLRRLGRTAEARKSYEAALQLNPRAAAAWLSLAEMAGGDEYDVLRRADAAGTASATLLTRLAALEVDRGQDKAADGHLAEATTLLPGLSSAWLLWAALAEKDGRDADAIARFERAATTDPKDPTAFLHMGRLQLRRGDSAGARRNLQTAMALAPSSPAGREAARLLQTFQP